MSGKDKLKPDSFCDGKCNDCPIISHPNSKVLTVILNKLYDKFGSEAYKIVQEQCPNLTCCYDCHIDDFCHMEGCKLIDTMGGHNANQ